MMILPTLKYLFLLSLFLFTSPVFSQFEIPKKPTSYDKLVFDYADVLNTSEEYTLNQKLIGYEDSTATQIIVACVKTLNQDDPNLIAAEWGEKWGAGQKKEDNGLIILLAIDDHKMAIQNGYGLEPLMTDSRSKRIINEFFIPFLKQEKYFSAIDKGTDAIFLTLNGEFKDENPDYDSSEGDDFWMFLLIGFGLLLFIIISSKGKGGGNNNGDGMRGFGRDIIFTDFGRSTWSGGGGFGSSGGDFGGGGFGGFGGGSFGGGGASGSW